MHSSEEHSPGYSTGVLALQEKRLGFAILESEDFAVTTDVEFALQPPQKDRSAIIVFVRVYWNSRRYCAMGSLSKGTLGFRED